MLTNKELQAVINSQEEQIKRPKAWVERDISKKIQEIPGFATVISGVRRSGKSTLLKQIFLSNPSRYCYLHFDDPRLIGFKQADFLKLDELFPSKTFLFDEIQQIKDWERFIRMITDRGEPVYVTGSNAALLSMELGTLLTGRHLSYEVFPFSPSELHSFSKEIDKKVDNRIIELGGFPEFIKHESPLILQGLFKDILERDIIARYNIRNIEQFKSVAQYLINNIARLFSLRKISNTLGIASANTTSTFIQYLENSYLFFSVSKYDHSFKKQQVSHKKIYSIDSALVLWNSVKLQKDTGRLLENQVFIQLRRNSRSIYYYQKKYECDFITKSLEQKFACFQVCAELNNNNLERELNGLLEAMDIFELAHGVIITLDQQDSFTKNGKSIKAIPFHRYFQTAIEKE